MNVCNISFVFFVVVNVYHFYILSTALEYINDQKYQISMKKMNGYDEHKYIEWINNFKHYKYVKHNINMAGCSVSLFAFGYTNNENNNNNMNDMNDMNDNENKPLPMIYESLDLVPNNNNNNNNNNNDNNENDSDVEIL